MTTIWMAGLDRRNKAQSLVEAKHLFFFQSFYHMPKLWVSCPDDPPFISAAADAGQRSILLSYASNDWKKAMSNIWLAGSLNDHLVQGLVDGGHKWHLNSFLDAEKALTMKDPTFNFFLDSGAYSAWSKGADIDLDEYVEFIKRNVEHLDVYVNLDCIPGRPGQDATPAERERGAARSWENFIYMTETCGVKNVIPVFHCGEDVKWLKKMLDYGCPYLGFGGMGRVPRPARQQWLDQTWSDYMVDDKGYPIRKVHGFAMTAIDFIFRYPWYSVDSTTWLKITASGGIIVPRTVNGQFVFDRSPTMLSVSDVNPNQHTNDKHVNSLPPAAKTIVERWLAECGKTLADVSSHYSHRAVVNVSFFRRVSEAKGVRPLALGPSRRKSLW